MSVSKDGNDSSEYEDASCIQTVKDEAAIKIYAAVADGATDSSFAGEWAKMLVRAFSKGTIATIEDLKSQIEQVSKRWLHVVNRKPMPWYAEERIKQGAFATLCGITLVAPEENVLIGTYKVMAVGDSCMFQVRKKELIKAVPINNSTEFGNTPLLLSSGTRRNDNIWDHVVWLQGQWQKGDYFLLMTDAIAQWFLQENEKEHRPWEVLFQISEEENYRHAFIDWVSVIRNDKKIKNDDTTVLIIKL
jgi:hypothetical protein